MITVTLAGQRLAIRFPFNRAVLAYVKTLPGRIYEDGDPADKHWTAPISVLDELMTGCQADQVSVDYEALRAFDEAQEPLRQQYRRLFANLEGEPSPELIAIAERYEVEL